LKPVPSALAGAALAASIAACSAASSPPHATSSTPGTRPALTATATGQPAQPQPAAPASPAPAATSPASSATAVACDMLLKNAVLARLVNTTAPVHIIATGELMPNVPECQVGLARTTSFTHGVEGGMFCHYPNPHDLIDGPAIAANIYRSTDLPRTFLMITGPHAAIAITFFLDADPTPNLVVAALQSAASIVNAEGCP
jgi:hypothetical protein